jgi:hypothetical protein
MEETIKVEMTKEETVELQQLLDEVARRLNQSHEEMAQAQVRIEAYGLQTQTIIDRMRQRAA